MYTMNSAPFDQSRFHTGDIFAVIHDDGHTQNWYVTRVSDKGLWLNTSILHNDRLVPTWNWDTVAFALHDMRPNGQHSWYHVPSVVSLPLGA